VIAFATDDTVTEVTLATLFDVPANTFCQDAQCRMNGSTIQQHVLQFRIPGNLDTDGDGFVTLAGYTDQFMRAIQPGLCETPGPHPTLGFICVPFELEHMPIGLYEYRDDAFGIGVAGTEDFDTSPAGEYWITWFHDMVDHTH